MPAARRPSKKAPRHEMPRDEMPNDFSAHHEQMNRFPSADEIREMDAEWGIDRSIDPSQLALRVDRQIDRLADSLARSASSEILISLQRMRLELAPSLLKLILSLLRRRVNHQALDTAARNRFNQALQAAYGDGSYQAIALVHSQMWMMHSSMGAAGTQRFLPWHRLYLYRLEELLRQKQPSVTVPYWDYANDHTRPDWVWQPPGVVRNAPGAKGGSLPTQPTIDSILLNSSYSSFTFALETGAHNQVHNWCNGTVSAPPTASQDPIFWLLHSNVDRLWDTWQLSHTGVPTLTGSDPMTGAVLGPWGPTTASDVNHTEDMLYSYA